MQCIEQSSGRKTYPKLGHNPLRHAVVRVARLVLRIRGADVVLVRVGRLSRSDVGNQAWEVFPAEKTHDAIRQPFVSTWDHDLPRPA